MLQGNSTMPPRDAASTTDNSAESRSPDINRPTEDGWPLNSDVLTSSLQRPEPPSIGCRHRPGPRTRKMLLNQGKIMLFNRAGITSPKVATTQWSQSSDVPSEAVSTCSSHESVSISEHLYDNGDLTSYLERKANREIANNLWQLYMLQNMCWIGPPLVSQPVNANVFRKIGEFLDHELCSTKSLRGARSTSLDTLRYQFPASMRSDGTAPPRGTNITSG